MDSLISAQESKSGKEHHSTTSTTLSIGQNEKSNQDESSSPSRLAQKAKKPEGRVRGIFSRLTRPKQVSYGKELDKLPAEKKPTSLKQSLSVPNLTSLDSNRSGLAAEFLAVVESDCDSCQSEQPNRENDGLFV